MRQETGRKTNVGEKIDSPFSSLNFKFLNSTPPHFLIINQLRAVFSACLLLATREFEKKMFIYTFDISK